MKPLELEDCASPRTEALIAKVMAKHPFEHLTSTRSIKGAMAKYYEAVHQELAPLCRELESENRALRELSRRKQVD